MRSLAVDEAAAAIPNNGTLEKPHLGNPVAFVSDTKNNRVCRLEFGLSSHDTAVKVTEFLVGLKDPWDVICVDGVLYVSERLSHRIAAYDATTGAFLRVVVSGADLAGVTAFRAVQRFASVSTIRAEQCVAPEGMSYLDGWLYFASYAMAQVKRVHLTTGVIETIVTIDTTTPILSGGNFMKIAVSDGSFGPRGTVFFSSWAIANGGRPLAFLPDGTSWPYAAFAAGGEGPGPVWIGIDYGCAVAVGQGRMVCSSSIEGLWDHHKAAGEPKWGYEADRTARVQYQNRGLHLTHGPAGWGYYGLPLPWGVTPEIDNYLKAHGHTRAAA